MHTDEAISAQAKFKFYRKPEDHVFKLMERWSNHNCSALRRGLDVHGQGKKDMKDLASIAAIEKTWTHRFIDRNERLRSMFAKVSTVPPCSATQNLHANSDN
jgi:hypothetical protein